MPSPYIPRMMTGILAGLGSGALWGLVFALPKILPELSSSQVALGRFLSYGVLSAGLLSFQWAPLKTLLNWPTLRAVLILSLTGNAAYYFMVVLGVRLAGVPMTSLIIGLLPLSIAVLSNRGQLPKKLILPLSFILTGVILISFDLFRTEDTQTSFTTPQKISGILFSAGALAVWTWYAVRNAQFLKSRPEISVNLWTSLIGVGTLVCMIPIEVASALYSGTNSLAVFSLAPEIQLKLILCSLILGVGSSWLAYWLWNIASQRLPTSLAGQLIVSETVFALIYGFIVDQRAPTGLEIMACLFFISGVIFAIRTYRRLA